MIAWQVSHVMIIDNNNNVYWHTKFKCNAVFVRCFLDCGVYNDIYVNIINSVGTVFKLYIRQQTVYSNALKYITQSKYLGFTFND